MDPTIKSENILRGIVPDFFTSTDNPFLVLDFRLDFNFVESSLKQINPLYERFYHYTR